MIANKNEDCPPACFTNQKHNSHQHLHVKTYQCSPFQLREHRCLPVEPAQSEAEEATEHLLEEVAEKALEKGLEKAAQGLEMAACAVQHGSKHDPTKISRLVVIGGASEPLCAQTGHSALQQE